MLKAGKTDRMKLLLISEEERKTEACIPLLERAFEVVYVADNIEGLIAFKENNVHFVIRDFTGSKSTCCHVIEQIRQYDLQIPIYITTDCTTLDGLEWCVKVGINGLFKKPFTSQSIISKVKNDLSSRASLLPGNTLKAELPRNILLMSKHVQKALYFIHDNFFRPIGKRNILDAVKVNPDYLGRIFKKECGLTIPQYIGRLRVERAKEILANSSITIAEIAETVGFQNENYFYVLFREIAGVSPGKFRRMKG